MIRQIARTLEVSVVLHSDGMPEESRQQRHRDIKSMPNPIEQWVAMAVDNVAAMHPRIAKTALWGCAKGIAGLDYQGHGAMSSVYRDDDRVLKVIPHTANMTGQQRADYADLRNDICARTASVLGPVAVPQLYIAETHPFGDYAVVVARQPYITGSSLDLFEPNTTRMRSAQIDDFCARAPTSKNQLQELVQSTFILKDEQNMVPDLNGSNNLRVDVTGTCRLIDPEPILFNEDPTVSNLILSQAEALGKYLDQL